MPHVVFCVAPRLFLCLLFAAATTEWLQNIRASFPQNPITGNPLLFTDEAWGPDTPDNGQPRGMPFLTSQWVFPLKREYDGTCRAV